MIPDFNNRLRLHALGEDRPCSLHTQHSNQSLAHEQQYAPVRSSSDAAQGPRFLQCGVPTCNAK